MVDQAEDGKVAGASDSRGTRVRAPDLDWSQVHETMLMLELAAGQIDAALTESGNSVDTLTESFTSLAGHLLTMGAALKHLPDDGDVGRTKARLKGAADNVNVMVGQAIAKVVLSALLVPLIVSAAVRIGRRLDGEPA